MHHLVLPSTRRSQQEATGGSRVVSMPLSLSKEGVCLRPASERHGLGLHPYGYPLRRCTRTGQRVALPTLSHAAPLPPRFPPLPPPPLNVLPAPSRRPNCSSPLPACSRRMLRIARPKIRSKAPHLLFRSLALSPGPDHTTPAAPHRTDEEEGDEEERDPNSPKGNQSPMARAGGEVGGVSARTRPRRETAGRDGRGRERRRRVRGMTEIEEVSRRTGIQCIAAGVDAA
ncbi:hypothetical protein B0H14DRAFT_326550 [Mycena olivaceomarginata]|nr:hypothetical protein B0H14DRAFT_326550 [Mycena olivaceomarginata]